jgi:hypothetical protein
VLFYASQSPASVPFTATYASVLRNVLVGKTISSLLWLSDCAARMRGARGRTRAMPKATVVQAKQITTHRDISASPFHREQVYVWAVTLTTDALNACYRCYIHLPDGTAPDVLIS